MTATLICLHCGGALEIGAGFCAQCGVESVACNSCGRLILPGDPSCPHCGTPADPAIPSDGLHSPDNPPSPMADIVERLRRATLGEFEIGRELGRGGMAAVFLAHEISLDRKVAIKVMSPGLLMGEGMVERFKHEAITIAQLHHPNIVSVYSVRQAEGLHFFVMRYVQGRSLEHVVQRAGRLPLPVVRSILHQVGSALTYAHRSRVIHRDIKPGNILIDEEGNAVVTDFGIAKAAERPSRTLTGALVGTPAYMSPEQCSGGEVSGASDQYSLGRGPLRAADRGPAVRRLHAHGDAGARRAPAAANSRPQRRMPAGGRGRDPPHARQGSGRAVAPPGRCHGRDRRGPAGGGRSAPRRSDRLGCPAKVARPCRARRRQRARRPGPARPAAAGAPGPSEASPSCPRRPTSRPATASRSSP